MQRGATWRRSDDGELLRRVKDGAVTVIDVPPTEEFEAGHIPGAISMPLAELKKRVRDLPKDREVVAYCRGPYCVMALDAVEISAQEGLSRPPSGAWRRRMAGQGRACAQGAVEART